MKTTTFVLTAFASAAIALAQTPTATLPAPKPVTQIAYRHWPEQFMQWVGAELPYSMFELYVDRTAGAEPAYDVVLTERATWKRVHYSNVQALVDFNQRFGGEAYFAKIQFDRPAAAKTGAAYLLRFSDHSGTPVLWQFVQGSPVSERGGGLSPAGVQPPVLMFRERSAVAGEGTALKIGNVVSAADIWKEIAQPPYFVPYHGALTENVEIATFLDGGAEWSVEAAPATLEPGAEWRLKSADGRAYTLKASAVKGDIVTLEQSDARHAAVVTIDATFANNAWTTRKVHFAPSTPGDSKGITVTFTPENEQTQFEVQSGKTRIARGALVDSAWQFKDPEWLKSRGKVAQAKETPARSGGAN